MKKLEIINILNFYVLANKLKTTIIDEDNNYSVADHIFGSMILAIAMYSEFNETDNISLEKVLYILVLNEFYRLNPDCDLEILKNNYLFNEKLEKFHEFHTSPEARLVFKYKILDLSLTSLIEEKAHILSYNELLKEAIDIFTPFDKYQDYDKYEKVFNFYYLNYRLKNKVRSGWDKNHWNIKQTRAERISEHVVSTLALSMVIYSEYNYHLNISNILKTLVIHEVGKSLIGDITPFDGISQEQKLEIEKRAIIDVIGNLTKKDELIKNLFDFINGTTKEAIFAHYIDKLEADLQSKYYQDSGLYHSLDDQKNNCVFKNSKVQQMLQNGAKTAFDIWYEYDKIIYQSTNLYPEFSQILSAARDNDLTKINNGIFRTKIELDENTYNFLVDKISKVLKEMLDDDNIESIIMEHKSEKTKHKSNQLCIGILLKDNAINTKYFQLIRRINKAILKDNDTDIDIKFYCDYVSEYSINSLNQDNAIGLINLERLSLASILFDRNGRISKTKEILKRLKEDNYLHKYYLFDCKPPIDEPIIRKLKQ